MYIRIQFFQVGCSGAFFRKRTELTQVEGINIGAFVGLVEDNESVLSFTHFDLRGFFCKMLMRSRSLQDRFDRDQSLCHWERRVARILLYAPGLQRNFDAVEIREIQEFARGANGQWPPVGEAAMINGQSVILMNEICGKTSTGSRERGAGREPRRRQRAFGIRVWEGQCVISAESVLIHL